MSDEHAMNFDADLLDAFLGHLGDTEQQALQQRLARDPRLAAEYEAIGEVFAALGTYKVPPAPADLKQRILARVEQAGRLRIVSPSLSDPTPAEWNNTRIMRMHGVRDVLAVAAMVVMAVGLGVPGLLHMKERARRTMCAANLAQLGQGLSAYATVFGGSLPFDGWSPNYSWRPTSEPGVTVRPNRQHVYLLLRTGQVASKAFVCPSSKGVPMPSDQIRQHDDFLESRNLSYAYQNMAGRRPRLGSSDPRLVIMGDDNPLFDSGRPLFDVAAQALGLRDISQTNSRVHGGVGQNILSLDGSTRWVTTPNAGPGGDNIWTLDHARRYTGHEGPQSATDSHLLK